MLSLLSSFGMTDESDGVLSIIKDQDQDGIADEEDDCPTIP